VMTAALYSAERRHRDYEPRVRVAGNFSPNQFRDPELVGFIEKALRRSGVSGEQLELEITEGVLMGGQAYIDKALDALNKLGVHIAMDDFGTGYSSLSYLRRYHFHVLKIDVSFVRGITVDPSDRALIDATISMAHGLGLEVVAEGVETAQQLAYLKKRGCDYVQGNFFAKPMPESNLPGWFRTGRILKREKSCRVN